MHSLYASRGITLIHPHTNPAALHPPPPPPPPRPPPQSPPPPPPPPLPHPHPHPHPYIYSDLEEERQRTELRGGGQLPTLVPRQLPTSRREPHVDDGRRVGVVQRRHLEVAARLRVERLQHGGWTNRRNRVPNLAFKSYPAALETAWTGPSLRVTRQRWRQL